MDDQSKAEERNECGIRRQGGPVLVHAYAWRTVLRSGSQSAVLVRSVAYEAVGVVAGVGHSVICRLEMQGGGLQRIRSESCWMGNCECFLKLEENPDKANDQKYIERRSAERACFIL